MQFEVYIYPHTYIHTYIHTDIHTYIQTYTMSDVPGTGKAATVLANAAGSVSRAKGIASSRPIWLRWAKP